MLQVAEYLHIVLFLDDLRNTKKIHIKANNYHIENREVSK